MMLREGWESEPNITVTLFTMNKRKKIQSGNERLL